MRSSLPYCGGTSASFTLLTGIVERADSIGRRNNLGEYL